MKKIIFSFIILILGYYIISIYIIDLKITASKEIVHLKRENKVLQNKFHFSIYREAIIHLNNHKISQNLQIATAGVYFCSMSKKNRNYFPKLNYKSSICTNWSKETYKKYFSEVNMTMDINCVIKGLDIVNNICLSNIE
jgi:hypothetical protein